MIIAVDGTGLATTNRGEWLRYIHKKEMITKRNGFVKLLISVDISTQEIVGIKVFDDSQGEVIYLTDVLLQSIQNKNQPINTLLADGSYDKYNIFEMLQQAGVLPIINIRKNADLMLTEDTDKFKTRRRKIDNKLPVRTLVAREQLKDKENWKKDNGYGQRWTVEYVFSAFKRLFGQAITSRKKENVENELIAKANLYNLLLKC